jgi:phosphoribosylformylglycinamidine synthase
VVTFPGSLDDRDALRAVAYMGGDPVPLWHGDPDLRGAQAVVLPGGFSYGDYLRTGAIARFAVIMDPIRAFAEAGGPVLGICNGFQILCEAGLLPGALIRNRGLSFICRWVHVVVDRASPIAGDLVPGDVLGVPIKHGEGQFVASEEELASLEAGGRVAFRYASADGAVEDRFNPNGSSNGIAGVWNEAGNVLGLMPHPEHAVDPDLGPTGGQPILEWLLSAAESRARVPA